MLSEVDVRKSELGGKSLGNLFFGCSIQTSHDDTQSFAGALLLSEGGLEVILSNEARSEQALADPMSHV
jgi:hypothetical protein